MQLRAHFSFQLRLLATALVFYTRVPLPLWFEYSSDYLRYASRYLPAIGLFVGGVGAATFWLANLVLSPSISIALSMSATVLLTGAFHEDGFADVCDGFGGGWTPERILEIMKDPRVGSFGTVGVVLILLLKFLALQELAVSWIPYALIAGHIVSRMVAISYLATHQYVQVEAQSKVKALAEQITKRSLGVAIMTVIIVLTTVSSSAFWLALLPLLPLQWLLGKLFTQKLGGYTGDCLGAAQQISEVFYYLSLGIFLAG